MRFLSLFDESSLRAVFAKQSCSYHEGIASLAEVRSLAMTCFFLNEKREALWSYSQ
jgi:hypothetical protein